MAEPKFYPSNDSAETRSINLIELLLDPDFVKTHFAKRDRLQFLVDYALPEYQALLERIKYRPPKPRFWREQLSAYQIKWTDGESRMPLIKYVGLTSVSTESGMKTARGWSVSGAHVTVDGITGECVGRGEWMADGLFRKTPLLDTVYAMLLDDLRRSYPHFRNWGSDRCML